MPSLPAALVRGLLTLATVALPASAQQVPTIRLASPDLTVAHEFSAISGFRELSDGRLLVSDGIEEALLRIDPKSGKVEPISRTGGGPGEYKLPDQLFEQPAGGTLLVDLGNGRLSFYDATLKYLSSMPIARGDPAQGGMTVLMPQAVDRQGRIYTQTALRGPTPTSGDSSVVVRFDRASGKTDTVARLAPPQMEVSQSGGANNRSMRMMPIPLSPSDQWSAGADGRIAVVRASDYSLEWLGGGKPRVKGPANRFTPVPIREADKREYGQDMAGGLSIMMTNQNGQVSMSMRRGRPAGAESQMDAMLKEMKWPATKPAARGVVVAPTGEAWVERHVAAGAPREYDIFSPDAKLVRKVVLPAGRRLAGFGKSALYLRAINEDELATLEQYRLP